MQSITRSGSCRWRTRSTPARANLDRAAQSSASSTIAGLSPHVRPVHSNRDVSCSSPHQLNRLRP
jgi:hypothetical protein